MYVEARRCGGHLRRRLMGTSSSGAAPAAVEEAGGGGGSSKDAMRIMVSVLVVVIFCTLLYCVYCWRWRKRNAVRRSQIERLRPMSSSDLPLMDLASILAATDSFSKPNKLGEGGFGPVYRGVLPGGAQIAVKRLHVSSSSSSSSSCRAAAAALTRRPLLPAVLCRDSLSLA
ncbi:hypothetical protein ABZP36_021537 [Zizania latifolia]